MSTPRRTLASKEKSENGESYSESRSMSNSLFSRFYSQRLFDGENEIFDELFLVLSLLVIIRRKRLITTREQDDEEDEGQEGEEGDAR
jgi:hypothetical protein